MPTSRTVDPDTLTKLGFELREPYLYAVWYDDAGRRFRRSTKCGPHDLKRAVEVRAQLIASGGKTHRDDPDHHPKGATLGHVLGAFIGAREGLAERGIRSTATVDYYLKKAGVLRGYFEPDGSGFPIARLTGDLIEQYIETRRHEADDTTIGKELALLKGALKAAKKRHEYEGDIDMVFVTPDDFDSGYKPRKTFLSREQLATLIEQLPAQRAAVVAFIVATTCELRALGFAMRTDVTYDGKRPTEVQVHGTKRETRERAVPIVTDDQERLLRFALQHADGTDGRLFSSWSNIRRDLREAVDRANEIERKAGRRPLPYVSPNDLRRTAGSWLRASGIALDHVGKVMGHKDSKMVELVYGQLTTNELANLMRQAVGKAPKKAPKATAKPVPLKPRPATKPRVRRASKIPVSTKSLPNPTDLGALDGLPREARGLGNLGESVPRDRIELSTRGFSVHCSTN